MKILAIGGSGFIGARFVSQALEAGHEVALFTRGNRQVSRESVLIEGDRNSLPASLDKINAFGPDVVVDFILYTEQQARDLVGAFHQTSTRIVAISSADVYRNYDGLRGVSGHTPDPVPLGEYAPLRDNLFPYRGAETDFEWADEYEKIIVERTVLNKKTLTRGSSVCPRSSDPATGNTA